MPAVNAVSPANAAVGVALGTPVAVTFDLEMDPDSLIGAGNFILRSGASKVVIAGPDSRDFSLGSTEDYLEDDVAFGVVSGTVTTSDNLTFKFTPSSPLKPNVSYKAIVNSTVVTRTLSTAQANGGNGGTGSVVVSGPYTGAANGNFVITIASAGALGAATFTYTVNGGAPSAAAVTDRKVTLIDGVTAVFKAGTYNLGDSFSFTASVGQALGSIYSFSFTTGDSAYVEPSDTVEAFQIQQREVEGLKRIDGVQIFDMAPLALAEVSPENQSIEVSARTRTITLTFSKEIDPASVTDAFIEVLMETMPFDIKQSSYRMAVTPSVSGKVLTLKIG